MRDYLPWRGRALCHINFDLTRSAGDDCRCELGRRRRLGLRWCGNSDGLVSDLSDLLLYGRDSK